MNVGRASWKMRSLPSLSLLFYVITIKLRCLCVLNELLIQSYEYDIVLSIYMELLILAAHHITRLRRWLIAININIVLRN